MTTKKNDILNTALALFSVYGYHGMGVDRIKDEAGVSKMTLYKYFPTKEILIEGTLAQRDRTFIADLQQCISRESSCVGKLYALFKWHEDWFKENGFHGCMFIKAAEEFPDANSPIRHVARQHKTHIRAMICSILEEAGVDDAQPLSQHLLLLLDGAIVNANMFSDPSCIENSWPFVQELLLKRGC